MIGTNKENDVNSASDSTSSKYSSCAWKTREETMEMLSINKQAIEKHHCVVVCCKKFIRIIRTIRMSTLAALASLGIDSLFFPKLTR